MNPTPAHVKVKVKMEAVKIHGPNSTLAPKGTREPITMDEPVQIVEMTREQVSSMFGEEAATALFKGIGETA